MRGLACHLPYDKRGALLPHLFTLTRQRLEAVYFLCHFPSGHPDRVLPGTLLCGVRTFLSAYSLRINSTRSGRPANYDGMSKSVMPNTAHLGIGTSDTKFLHTYGSTSLTLDAARPLF